MLFDAESNIAPIISLIGLSIEVIGVLLIVGGFLGATARHLRNRGEHRDERFRVYRRELAQSMLLGLEFLVAGDIIRTVIIDHTLNNVLALGLVVLIRTVLVFTVHLEVEGRWPWQSAAKEDS